MADVFDDQITEKLGIEEGMRVGVLNAPNWFNYDFGGLPDGVTVYRDSFEQPADLFLVFAAHPAEAERGFQRALTALPPDGKVWVAWETARDGEENGLDEATLRELFADTGMVGDEALIINDTWKGLRFVVSEDKRGEWEDIRPEEPVIE